MRVVEATAIEFNGTELCRTIHCRRRCRWSEGGARLAGAGIGERTIRRRLLDRMPTAGILDRGAVSDRELRARMIAIQEELDWEMYRLYGLIDEDLTYSGDDLPRLALGERAFEIVLARAVEAGEEETAWFARHGSTPITEIPAHWPTAYRELVQRRLDLIASNPSIRLLERPEYKRRWAQEPWEKRQERALRDWLLDRLEDRRFWFDGAGAAVAAERGAVGR